MAKAKTKPAEETKAPEEQEILENTTQEPTIEEQTEAKESPNDMVDFFAFKDNDKYKDDIFVAVNGKRYQIKRGQHVKIPRFVAEVLEASRKQDTQTAEMIEKYGEEYEQAKGVL